MTNRILRRTLLLAAVCLLAFAGSAAAGSTNVGLISFGVSKPTKATKKKPRIVTIRWRTGSEPDTLGFNLYREARVRVKLNRAAIVSRGKIAGAAYKWVDRLPKTVKGFPCYRLESVSTRGARTFLKRACSGKVVTPATKPVNISLPVVSGTAAVGSPLTTTSGAWRGNPLPTFTFQWKQCDPAGANCTSIPGATSPSYTVLPANVGFTLRVDVRATNSAGSAIATSAPTAVVTSGAPVNTTAPVISGTATVGSTLSATTGDWTGSPTFTYQWTQCDPAGANCTSIAGATGQTYTVVAANVGFTLRVDVTATNSAGSATATSNPTPVVT